mmetsp:Transcript_73057/g.156486  ORF Transcript_73057/g.156486 Transcript_73057/m.156486 type:complete len:394 (+) Transcript_73057:97-1278(+)
MAVPGNVKTALALLASTALLWKPTIVVMFPGFLYTSDLSTVFLSDGCIGSTTQTVFVFCLLEVLVACVLLKAHVVPALFGEARWQSFSDLKQRKLLGFLIKIIVRIACAVQILSLVVTQLSLQDGLFARFNVKAANAKLVMDKVVTTCAGAGMVLSDAAAMRAWTFARDDMMAVMVWELAFIPELPLDAWLHHLFVILGVALGSDPQLLGSRAAMQPLIDAVAFFLVLGAALAASVEAAVLMYHFSAPDAARQAKWMTISIVVQAILVAILFVAFPFALVIIHRESFGFLVVGILALIVFLAAVEVKMIAVKLSIVKSSRRKARAQHQTSEAAAAPLALPASVLAASVAGSFNHDISRDAVAIDPGAPGVELEHGLAYPCRGSQSAGAPSCVQ